MSNSASENQNSLTTERAAGPAIAFRNVSLSLDGVQVLSDITFELGRGEMILVTGASGSGKSVMLHLAMGLLRPEHGQILIEGREIDKLGETELLAVRGGLMGMVFQEESLFTGLSVYDNTAYRLEDHGWQEEEIDRAVQQVLSFVGLQGEEDRFPEELSGGMKRRVEVARALIGWPSIMLFDEPTLSLDPIVALQILELIMRARDINGISSLYVTKKLHEIPYLATYHAVQEESGAIAITKATSPATMPRTRVLVLENGKIAFFGGVEEFQRSQLPAITVLTSAEDNTPRADFYVADPWDKSRKPSQEIL